MACHLVATASCSKLSEWSEEIPVYTTDYVAT